MSSLTSEGKDFALAKLAERRKQYSGQDHSARNSDLPAGSPMYFGCKTCNAVISVPESYTHRPTLCRDCQDLKDVGWLT
jgi:hypothetical protein